MAREGSMPLHECANGVPDAAPPQSKAGSPLLGGTRLGPYEIVGLIGAGGMGEVYRAHDTNLNRVVALKLLPEELSSDVDQRRRFEQEARIASALNHPAIVTIYDAGRIGSHAYISMELVAGDTLREILARGAIPLRRALRIAAQLADGLAAAHEAGLVHRDLKPENIKVSSDHFAKILDFGLAKRVSADLSALPPEHTKTSVHTMPGVILGTVGYMSPEQAGGGRVEFSSDQFSFGLILYEMLTGRRAFERPSTAETLSAIIREDPPPIAQLNPAVPPPVRWIVERCLAKDPQERYVLTRDLARELASVREHLSELPASRRGRTTRRATGDVTVAVMPVMNLSGISRQEPLADAMTDALITALTRCPGLRVMSRTSTMTYKGQRCSVTDIADELGLHWVVLASLAKVNGEIRLTAQLVDAENDENRWAQSYTRRSRNVLSMQVEIANAIAQAVSMVITAPSIGAAAGNEAANPAS
jgi:serine/threonine protein kinase